MSKQTRSANGSGTIRKRADGRWEGIYSAGYDQQTGKLIRKSIYGKNQKEVRQKLSKVTTEIDEGLYLEPAKMTLSDWMDLWYKEYTFDKKYSTLKGYKAQINKHIRPGIGKYNQKTHQCHVYLVMILNLHIPLPIYQTYLLYIHYPS